MRCVLVRTHRAALRTQLREMPTSVPHHAHVAILYCGVAAREGALAAWRSIVYVKRRHPAVTRAALCPGRVIRVQGRFASREEARSARCAASACALCMTWRMRWSGAPARASGAPCVSGTPPARPRAVHAGQWSALDTHAGGRGSRARVHARLEGCEVACTAARASLRIEAGHTPLPTRPAAAALHVSSAQARCVLWAEFESVPRARRDDALAQLHLPSGWQEGGLTPPSPALCRALQLPTSQSASEALAAPQVRSRAPFGLVHTSTASRAHAHKKLFTARISRAPLPPPGAAQLPPLTLPCSRRSPWRRRRRQSRPVLARCWHRPCSPHSRPASAPPPHARRGSRRTRWATWRRCTPACRRPRRPGQRRAVPASPSRHPPSAAPSPPKPLVRSCGPYRGICALRRAARP